MRLSAVNEDGRALHEKTVSFWENYAFDSDSDFGEAAELLTEIAGLATQLAKDHAALNKALAGTRG